MTEWAWEPRKAYLPAGVFVALAGATGAGVVAGTVTVAGFVLPGAVVVGVVALVAGKAGAAFVVLAGVGAVNCCKIVEGWALSREVTDSR